MDNHQGDRPFSFQTIKKSTCCVFFCLSVTGRILSSTLRIFKAILGIFKRKVPTKVPTARNGKTSPPLPDEPFFREEKIGKLAKLDNVYMENPNLLHALSTGRVDTGTARESFAVGRSQPVGIPQGRIQKSTR